MTKEIPRARTAALIDIKRLKAALIERYWIQRELGRGGMGIVYLAHDVKHDRRVALKVLRPEAMPSKPTRRFLREIQIVAKLNHPHILPLYDSDEADGFLFFIMPYVEGESLGSKLRREQQLGLDEAIQLARDVAEGLSHAHEMGVIHRDIKPENILLSGGHALIADFGIARVVHSAGGATLTSAGKVVGTPLYMSPEQASGVRDVDAATDIYSLGCVLYEMLAGEPPYSGPSVHSIIAKHALDPIPDLRKVRRHVPKHIVGAINGALEKAPADRFESAAAFARALS